MLRGISKASDLEDAQDGFAKTSDVITNNYTEERRCGGGNEGKRNKSIILWLTLDWWSSNRCPAGGNRWPPEGRPPSRPTEGEIGWTKAWCRAESWGRLRTASRRKMCVLSVTCITSQDRLWLTNCTIFSNIFDVACEIKINYCLYSCVIHKYCQPYFRVSYRLCFI